MPARFVVSGWNQGARIRRARIEGRCHYWLGEAGRCRHIIAPGELYAEGEPTPDAGGFARERLCAAHFTAEELGEAPHG